MVEYEKINWFKKIDHDPFVVAKVHFKKYLALVCPT